MVVAGMVVQARAVGRRARMSVLVLAAAVVLVGCGGRASSQQSNESGGGGSTAGAPATSGGPDAQPTAGTGAITGLDPQPLSTVRLIGGGANAVDLAPIADAGLGPCFVGFSALLNGMRVGIIAFVQQPGVYTGDSPNILSAQATTPDGRSYVASAGSSYQGVITLHVSSVVPRFAGTAELLLVDEADPEADPLALSLSFDVVWEQPCGS
jgi:hypothetical protein